MLQYQQTSWVIPFCAIWCIGFLIACANLPCHFRGEGHGEITYRWPPRPFREVSLIKPLWPVVFFLPAVLWPVWLMVTVVRQHTARDVGDEEKELESLVERGPAVLGPWGWQAGGGGGGGGGWEEQKLHGRPAFENRRGPEYRRPGSRLSV